MKVWMARLGPGLMLAAAAVGVSHLVQSTRAGADFGLSFVWLVILISFLKYPAFRFAVDLKLAGRLRLLNPAPKKPCTKAASSLLKTPVGPAR